MNVKTLKAQSVKQLKQQLIAYTSADFKPTLAVVFSSPKQSLQELQSLFNQQDIQLIGCSSAGEIADSEVLTEGIVGLLFDINVNYYKTHIQNRKDKSTYQVAYDMGLSSINEFTNPAIFIMSGGVSVNADEIIFGLKDSIKRDIPIFGGLAGDDLALNKTYVFNNQYIVEDGLLSWIIDNDKIEVQGLAASGWEAIGTTNTITKAEGNLIYSINNEPALDVFLKYFGFFDNTNMEGKPITTISAQYPLQVIRDNGHNVLRSPLMGDEENRTLMLAGGVKTGDQFRFSISPGFEVIDQTIEEFQKLKTTIAEVDALILISCKGRHAALGPMIEDEIEGIYNYWKAPMIGFFSYGEIGMNESGTCDFHNETCSLIAFKEK